MFSLTCVPLSSFEFRLFSLPQTIAGATFGIIGMMMILMSTVLFGINRVLSKK
jgi:hypothetical protein